MFDETFSGCTSLSGSIPDGLFGTPNNTPATYMFYRTFYNCSGLTGEIPARLFGTPKGAPKTYMFRETFYNCSGLTGTIPSTLFGGAVTSTSGLSGSGVGYMFYGTFRNCTNLSGYVPEDLFGNLTKSSTSYQMSYVFADSGLLTECPCGTIDVSADNTFYSTYWRSTAGAAEPRKVACRVDTTSGNYYWYNNQCSTICPLDTMDELHAGNTSYTVLASKLTDVAINVKYGDTTCYVPLTAGNGGANSLNMTYNNTVYHADRPGTMPPAGFGQR